MSGYCRDIKSSFTWRLRKILDVFILCGRFSCILMQAESAMDQMDWIEKITGVIASLLSAQSPEQVSVDNIISRLTYFRRHPE